MRTPSIQLAAVLAAGALALAACGGSDSDSGSSGSANPTSTSDSSPTGDPAADCGTINFLQPLPESIIFWPLITSRALGYFADEGIEVNLLPGGELPETAFVENGEADIASAGGPEVMQAIDAGANLKVVYDYWNVAAEGLVTLADGPSSPAEVSTVGLVTDSDAATVEIIWASLGLDPASVNTIRSVRALLSRPNHWRTDRSMRSLARSRTSSAFRLLVFRSRTSHRRSSGRHPRHPSS